MAEINLYGERKIEFDFMNIGIKNGEWSNGNKPKCINTNHLGLLQVYTAYMEIGNGNKRNSGIEDG
jgi:hypothetical protein